MFLRESILQDIRYAVRAMRNSVGLTTVAILSLGLGIGAGLLARSLQAFLTADLGYDPKGVLTAQATLHGSGMDSQRYASVGEQLLAAFRSVPGVQSASWGRISSSTKLSQLVVPGPGGSERRSGSYLNFISPDYFSTRRTPMLAGRDFNAGDSAASPAVAVLSEDLAKVLFGGVNPIGLRFRENDGQANGRDYLVEVVGVARDIQYRRPDYGPLTILYRPVSQCASLCWGIGFYEIRAAGPIAETTKRLESAASVVDSRVSLKLGLLSNVMDSVLHRNRAMALISTAFGLFVGLLAMMGVYGVTSYATAERTREIGIRMALGAKPGDVLRMVLGQTMRVVCLGAALGAGAGVAAARMFEGIIWGVKTTDPLSFGFGVCLMLLIAGIAAFLPARRAMSVDPTVALRFE
jgi:predicted permease